MVATWCKYSTGITAFIGLFNKDLPMELVSTFQVKKCKLCEVPFKSPINANMHYSGRPHRDKVLVYLKRWGVYNNCEAPKIVATSTSALHRKDKWCEVCNLKLTSKSQADAHYRGKAHSKEFKKHNTKSGPSFSIENRNKKEFGDRNEDFTKRFFCNKCQLQLKSKPDWDTHTTGKKHSKKVAYMKKQDSLKKQLKSKSSDDINKNVIE